MDKIELETIEFVNKGDVDFDTKKQPINASNLNQMQTNTNNALSNIQDNIGNALESINTNIETLNQEIDDKMVYFTEETTLNDLVIKSNLLGDNSKINASEIAVVNDNTAETLDKKLNNLETTINNMSPVTVYEDATGSNSSITLSQDVTNAKFFLVTYRQEAYTDSSKTDVVMNGENNHQLSFMWRDSELFYMFTTYIKISATTLSIVSGTALVIKASVPGAYGTYGTTVYITKVVAFY